MNRFGEIVQSYSNHFMANTAILMVGTVITQAISFFALPVLARNYGPTEYGLFASVLALLSVVNVIACGRYELAILLPKDEDEVSGLLILSFTVSMGVSLFAFIVCLGLDLAGQLSNPLYWFIPVLIPLSALAVILNYWLIRRKDYKTLALSRVVGGVVSTVIQLLFIVLSKSFAFNLLVGYLAGVTSALLILLLQFHQSNIQLSKKTVFLAWQMGRKYRRFPLIESWGAFADTLGTQMPIFLLQIFTNAETVGLYSMVVRLLSIPMNLTGSSFNSVFHEKIASINRSGNSIWVLVKQSTWILAGLSLIPYFILLISARQIVPFFLGSDWVSSIKMIQVLALPYWLNLVYSPLSLIFIIREKQSYALIAHLLIFIVPNLVLGYSLISFMPQIDLIFLVLGLSLIILYASLSTWSLSESARNPSVPHGQVFHV